MENNNKNTFGFKSKFLHSSNWIITIVAVIAVAVLFNVVVGLITDKFQFKIDLTTNRVIGITDVTEDVLENLDKDVNIVMFEDKGTPLPYVNEIIDQYTSGSSHIEFIRVDIVSDPGYIKKYELSANDIMANSIIVECGDKYKLIYPFELFPPDNEGNMGATIDAEGVLTSAITYVSSDVNTKIGVVEGHGEAEFLNSNMGTTLKKQFIDYENINLYTQDIPDDINYLVICGPERDFTAEEIDKIDTYLSEGNHLQMMFSATAPVLSNLDSYLSEWGIKVKNDTIRENNPNYVYNLNNSLVWVEGETHPITAELSQIIIPYSKSFDVDRDVNLDNLNVSTLFTTSSQATSIDNESGKETNGLFNLSMLSENSENGGSILVVGSSSIYADSYIEYNSRFFTNAMSYQSGTQQTTIIQPKSLVPASLKMSSSDIEMCKIIVVYLIPFAILVWGFIVWLRRRHL